MRVTRNTSNYKHIILSETEKHRIKFVIDKRDRAYDKLFLTKKWHGDCDPEVIVIMRYEDEEFINDILKRYGVE